MMSLTLSKPKKKKLSHVLLIPQICWCSFNLELIEVTPYIPRGSEIDGETQLEDNKALKYLNLIRIFV